MECIALVDYVRAEFTFHAQSFLPNIRDREGHAEPAVDIGERYHVGQLVHF